MPNEWDEYWEDISALIKGGGIGVSDISATRGHAPLPPKNIKKKRKAKKPVQRIDQSIAFICNYCGAKAGQKCKMSNGKSAVLSHSIRIKDLLKSRIR
jgi:hypothetical protein